MNTQRLYQTIVVSAKYPKQFRRRCLWAVSVPQSMPDISRAVAVVGYVGIFPERRPHGSKTPLERYSSETNVVFNVTWKKKQLNFNDVKSVVQKKMNTNRNNVHAKQRNEKQLRNIKYSITKINALAMNAADQIICVEEMSIIKRKTGHHPITFGPTLIHTNSSARTQFSFSMKLSTISNLVIGSDEGQSFRKAIQRSLSGCTHILCTRHLRQNTNKYLEDQVGYPLRERQNIINAIFGETGLTAAKDIDTFESCLNNSTVAAQERL